METQPGNNDTLQLPDPPPLPGLTFRHFRGASDYPLSLVALEVLGTFAGPYALWRSRRRVRRLGRTAVVDRTKAAADSETSTVSHAA